MLVGACLVLGGSQVVAAMSGMNVYAACFLIPLVVAAYVIVGGLRSTFIADYIHTVILFIAIFVFGFLLYASPLMDWSSSSTFSLPRSAMYGSIKRTGSVPSHLARRPALKATSSVA